MAILLMKNSGELRIPAFSLCFISTGTRWPKATAYPVIPALQ